jgi:hypothetical protein
MTVALRPPLTVTVHHGTDLEFETRPGGHGESRAAHNRASGRHGGGGRGGTGRGRRLASARTWRPARGLPAAVPGPAGALGGPARRRDPGSTGRGERPPRRAGTGTVTIMTRIPNLN